MLLEDYFDFPEPNVKRLKGHQIGIEDVILLYEQGYSAEQVVRRYPALTLEVVYATFTYYLRNKPTMEAYMERRRLPTGEHTSRYGRREPHEVIRRLRALRETNDTQRKNEAIFYTLP